MKKYLSTSSLVGLAGIIIPYAVFIHYGGLLTATLSLVFAVLSAVILALIEYLVQKYLSNK
jgi:hypothetical protein